MLYVMKKSGYTLILTLLVLVMAALVGGNAALAAEVEEKQVQAAAVSQGQTTENSSFLKSAAETARSIFGLSEALAQTPLESTCQDQCNTWVEGFGCSAWKDNPQPASCVTYYSYTSSQ